MLIIKKIAALRSLIASERQKKKKIGFVPTMGALHMGHIALIEACNADCDLTVCSIFVNPTQFNNEEDLKKYPKTITEDIDLLEESNCDVLFLPETEEIYPKPPVLRMHFGVLEQKMEGEFRPGHFSGVGIVVSKLFNIVAPDTAFFGQKDLQQFAVIQQMVETLNMPIQLIRVPTKRNKHGLALSSRNTRLSETGKSNATVLYKALTMSKKKLISGVKLSVILKEVSELCTSNNVEVEYLDFVKQEDLTSVSKYTVGNKVAICIAGYLEGVRLIDNILVEE